MPFLTSLDLSGCNTIAPSAYEGISRLTTLKKLIFCQVNQVKGDQEGKSLTALLTKALAPLVQLKYLNLSGSVMIVVLFTKSFYLMVI
jgi:hypothetical protein